MTIDYQAPLCREPGCGHHSWTGWCPDHREKKIAELSAVNPRSLSLTEKRFLRETEKRDTDDTLRIGDEVQQALPELFENRPTVEEIESAAMNIYIDGQESEVVRTMLTYQAATGDEADDDVLDRLSEPSYDLGPIGEVGEEEAADAFSRRDFFGQSQRDSALVSNYLLSKGHEARMARGDVDDGEGVAVEDDVEQYMSEKSQAWFGTAHQRLTSAVPRIEATVSKFHEEVDRIAHHQERTQVHMERAAQELGFNRLASYSKNYTPADASRYEKKYAWSEMQTMEMHPIRADETALMPQEQYVQNDPNPVVSREPDESKFVDNNGVVYNAAMEPIGSIHPVNQQQPQQPQYPQQMPHQNGGHIPQDMIRQRGNQPADPRPQWEQQPQQFSGPDGSSSLGRAAMRGTGKALGGVAKLGWAATKLLVNGSPNAPSPSEQRAMRRERQRMQQQQDANQALIDMNKRQTDTNRYFKW